MMEAQVQESVQLLISGGTSISQRGETNIKAGSERDVRHCLHFQGRKYTWEMIFQLKKINMEKISFTNNINQHINHLIQVRRKNNTVRINVDYNSIEPRLEKYEEKT